MIINSTLQPRKLRHTAIGSHCWELMEPGRKLVLWLSYDVLPPPQEVSLASQMRPGVCWCQWSIHLTSFARQKTNPRHIFLTRSALYPSSLFSSRAMPPLECSEARRGILFNGTRSRRTLGLIFPVLYPHTSAHPCRLIHPAFQSQ